MLDLWKLVSVCLERVSVQDRCTVWAKRTIGLDIVFNAPMALLVTRLKWKLVSVRVEIVLILMQDSCAVCDKRTIGSKIILDAPDGTPR